MDTLSDCSYTVSYHVGTPVNTAGETGEQANVRTDTITNSRSNGVVITLYDMKTRDPLANGTFTLKQADKALGTFTSDERGRITVMYDCQFGEDYTLTQTAPPDGYIGLPNPAVFSVAENHSVSVSGNDEKWANGRPATRSAATVIAYIDVFNKPFTLEAIKISTRTNAPMAGVHFALYRSVKGVGGQVKDYHPMAGYEDLVSDDSGVIPKIDNTLEPGTYYITEITPPTGYQGLAAMWCLLCRN